MAIEATVRAFNRLILRAIDPCPNICPSIWGGFLANGVEALGRFPLPVEVVPFGLGATRRAIERAFAEAGVSGQMGVRQMEVRKAKDGHVFVTDGGHWIIDAHLGRIADPPRLARLLNVIPGVVEHGLFIGLASTVILAGAQGIRVVERR